MQLLKATNCSPLKQAVFSVGSVWLCVALWLEWNS